MKAFRRGVFGLVLAATLSACGQAGPMVAVRGNGLTSGNFEAKAGPKGRKLDYGWERYKTVFAPKARPRRMPRQGLLPTRIDLREHDGPVYDQGDLGACTAFAMGKGMREHMQRRDDERITPLSALFLYYEERARQGTVKKDSGSTITEGMTVLKAVGCATDETWPYDVPRFKVKPAKPAYASASEYRIREATQLAELDDVRATLARGKTVAFGFLVYESFGKVGKDGVMKMPEKGDKVMGGHAVLAVGYDDQQRHLIVRNSWGKGWADGGYFYMPYDFAKDHERADDFWAAN
jgi:C1A family cysteine protease